MKATNSSYQFPESTHFFLSLTDQSTSMTSIYQVPGDSLNTHTDESIKVDHDESDLIFSNIAKEIVGAVNDYPKRKEG